MTTSLSHRRNTTFAPPPRRGPSLPWRQGVLLAPTLALLAAMLVAGPALSALRIGTDGADTLVGTNGADELTGKADNDLLRGLAGNDIYFFRDSWGLDTLDDRATYVVGGKRVSGGVDTLNFARTTRGVSGYMNIRQWGSEYQTINGAGGIALGTSVVEKFVGGQGADVIFSGGEANTLQPGGGDGDWFRDYGGWKEGAEGHPALPVSNDVYRGFTENTGTDQIWDWGGTADVLDMRPFSTDDVYIDQINTDFDPALESLVIVTRVDTTINPPLDVGVIVHGQFGAYGPWTDFSGMQGRIETILFADRTVTPSAVASLAAASVEASAEGDKTAEQADAAKRMASEARKELTNHPDATRLPGSGQDPDGNAHPGKTEKKVTLPKDEKEKISQKEMNDKKHDTQAKDKKEQTRDKQAKHDKEVKPGKRQGLQR